MKCPLFASLEGSGARSALRDTKAREGMHWISAGLFPSIGGGVCEASPQHPSAHRSMGFRSGTGPLTAS